MLNSSLEVSTLHGHSSMTVSLVFLGMRDTFPHCPVGFSWLHKLYSSVSIWVKRTPALPTSFILMLCFGHLDLCLVNGLWVRNVRGKNRTMHLTQNLKLDDIRDVLSVVTIHFAESQTAIRNIYFLKHILGMIFLKIYSGFSLQLFSQSQIVTNTFPTFCVYERRDSTLPSPSLSLPPHNICILEIQFIKWE